MKIGSHLNNSYIFTENELRTLDNSRVSLLEQEKGQQLDRKTAFKNHKKKLRLNVCKLYFKCAPSENPFLLQKSY